MLEPYDGKLSYRVIRGESGRRPRDLLGLSSILFFNYKEYIDMKSTSIKKYPTIACCGIDCGLCPRYHTDGKSKCSGCGGIDFFEKHPSCSILTCCVKKRELETCADCLDFPCEKMKKWDNTDSFVTHKNSLLNLRSIKDNGLSAFIKQQSLRIKLLESLIKNYDDGRSKSFYCIASTLLPTDDIKKAIKEITFRKNEFKDKKSIAKFLKNLLQQIADSDGIELIYRSNKS